MIHPRTPIINYAKALVQNTGLFGTNVFLNRTSPVLLEEIPCSILYFTDESIEVISGTSDYPRAYRRRLKLSVDVLIDEQTSSTEETIDDICYTVERAIEDDFLFKKLLPDYDPTSRTNTALLMGQALRQVTPYNPDSDGERRILAQSMLWDLPYNYDVAADLKLEDLNEYLMEIIKVGSDESTVDRVLLSAEGEF